MAQLAQESLHWVSQELAGTLKDARHALEQYADSSADSTNRDHLRECASSLHSAHGALRMVEVYGAALLTEEMVSVCKALYNNNIRSEAEALDALSRAVVQMPAYLDRVLGGGRDIPLVLLPLLNDLRAVRGSPLLSESTLFVLNIAPDRNDPAVGASPSGEDILFVAKRLRPRYQAGLLGWLRGEQVDSNLATMGVVAKALSQAATTGVFFQLWWVVGAVIEALRDEGLPSSAAVKRLLGQADRQIKRLLDDTESVFADAPPTDLLNNLLYYVARATSNGDLVQSVKTSFSLAELLPTPQAAEDDHAALSAPSATLMTTVGAAIKQDLSAVKDTLDLFVRSGMKDIDSLGSQLSQMKKIADTLGVLGLGELRDFVSDQHHKLQKYVNDGGDGAGESVLLEVAEALLSVEDRIDGELLEVINPTGVISGQAAGEFDSDYQQVSSAVIRECIVNLARVKDAIVQFIAQPDQGRALESLPSLLRGINAGMLLLDKPRTVEILERMGAYIDDRLRGSGKLPMPHTLDRLADAIVSVEYYLETLQSGRSDPWYMLDNAQDCLDALGAPLPATGDAAEAPVGEAASAPAPESEQVEHAPVPAQFTDSVPEVKVPESDRPEPPMLHRPVVDAVREAVDPDLLELFIEEAKEETASIRANHPAFTEQPDDRDLLLSLRRSFHTLKGSGRMVGAEAIGDFAWSIESLLNHVVDGTRPPGPGLIGVLEASGPALEQLIEQLEIGTPPRADIAGIVATAKALVDGEVVPEASAEQPFVDEDKWLESGADDDEVESKEAPIPADTPPLMAAQQPPTPELPSDDDAAFEAEPAAFSSDDSASSGSQEANRASQSPDQTMDPVLYEIFSNEASGHLEILRNFVDACRERPAPHPLEERVHRACHTLSGSANMAAADQAVAIAAPMNRFVRKAYEAGIDLDDTTVDLMDTAVSTIQSIVARINTDSPVTGDHNELIARFEALEREIEPAEATSADAGDPEPTDEFVAPAPEADAHRPAAPLPVTHDENFDPEIAEIFCEEAAELLDASDLALQGIARSPRNTGLLAELQRYLHSLKGGARMAGLTSMGDLSHELESLLIAIVEERQSADVRTIDVIQRSLDRLHSMRDRLSSGRALGEATDLVQQVRNLAAPDTGTDSVAVDLPERDVVDEHEPAMDVRALFEPATESAPPQSVAEPTSPTEAAPVEATDEAPVELADALADSPAEPPAKPASAFVERRSRAIDRQPERADVARVDAELLDELLNNAGEVSIYHSRMEQQVSSIGFNLTELAQTVSRLRDQLRNLEVETEAEIIHRHLDDAQKVEDFDPLEMDRYSTIQQLSRALAESVNDLGSLQGLLDDLTHETETLLVQQARVTTELQDGLMRTRMVPFRQYVPRFSRLVRQIALETGKRAELEVLGAGELDRQVLDRMVPPFEHMLRNAVVHGVESPANRAEAGKPETATLSIRLRREGSEMVIEVADDGAGMDVDRIRRTAMDRGLIVDAAVITDSDVLQLVLEPGFSTASELTQAAGRGVGMDVVANEVKQLGGRLEIDSTPGRGARFTVRLPLTLAISQALLVRTGDEVYAIPLPTVEGIVRIPKGELLSYLESDEPSFEYGGQRYRFEHLGLLLGGRPANLAEAGAAVPVVLVRAGDHSSALITDEMLGSREVVVKNVGPQIASISGVAGATILGDGSIVVILDVTALVRAGLRHAVDTVYDEPRADNRPLILVVDDSITVRRVTERLLERNGMRVITAKDGVDAVSIMQDHDPHLILLDIEMPRMDGYEVATHVRNSSRNSDVPIVMVTSRVGEKHRARAIEIGVDDYLGKPYQESQLLDAIMPLLDRRAQSPQPRATNR